jgi:hypothetical protein
VNCCVKPATREEDVGVTAIEIREGEVPEPLNDTSCGLEVPLSTTVKVAFRAPRALGVKVIEIVQLAPADSVAGLIGQLFVAA